MIRLSRECSSRSMRGRRRGSSTRSLCSHSRTERTRAARADGAETHRRCETWRSAWARQRWSSFLQRTCLVHQGFVAVSLTCLIRLLRLAYGLWVTVLPSARAASPLPPRPPSSASASGPGAACFSPCSRRLVVARDWIAGRHTVSHAEEQASAALAARRLVSPATWSPEPAREGECFGTFRSRKSAIGE